jgi:glycosyltransferase involved in cell wall biosynthesis
MVVPDMDRVGGYELQALSLAAHLRRAGVATFVLANNPWRHPPREERDGVAIHRLPPAPPHHPNWAALFVAFLRFLTSHRREYDVVHCHAMTFLAACCVRIGRLLGVPVVVKVATERDVREYRDNRSLHFRLFFRWLKRADRLLCLSESIRQEAIACGFRPEQAVVVPNGVDTERFRPPLEEERGAARAAFGLRDGEVALLFVGRLVQRKGVDVLLHALASVPDVVLLVAGDGAMRTEWEALAVRLGVGARTRFLGELQDVLPCYRAADVFAFPSRLEGLPNALLEAMACGLPAVATRIGGCADVIGDGCGVLVERDDAAGLAAAIARLAGNPCERARLGAAARARVEAAFAFAVTAARLQEVYAQLARSRACQLGS